MKRLFKTSFSLRQWHLKRRVISWLLLGFLTLLFSVSWQPIGRSQLPSLPSNDKELINRPRQLSGQMGNLLYAPIKIDGRPILLIAVPSLAKAQNGDEKNLTPLQDRVERIQNKLQEILKRDFDPSTLQVFPSTLNGQTVILVSDQKNFKPQTIGTITELDAELYGQSVNDIASEATKTIRSALINAWEERQPQSLQRQAVLAFQLVLLLLMISLVFTVLQNLAFGHIKNLKKSLLDLQTQTEINESSSEFQLFPKNRNILNKISDRFSLMIYWLITKGKSKTQVESPTEDFENPRSLTIFNYLIHDPKQLFNLEQYKFILTRKISIFVFLRRLLMLGQLFFWLRGIAFILTFFPYTRENGIFLAGAPASLLSIWLGILSILKIAELLIEGSLQTWSKDFNSHQQTSTRQIIRIPTIANALKSVNFVFFMGLGIILSLTVFDIPISTVLAGAGILGFAVSFGSQSLIKDLISGVINLANDAYAVGDVVIIGNDGGLVEDMNLFVTRIRSINGDLITIPNGSVGTVRNQSKDWSRVDYQIQVSYETNISQALEILLSIAQTLYLDPEWSKLILEPPDLKGVEDLSHQGVIIRVLLKTKPGEQWTVGRELRFRVKEAFEQAGITIGIPKQTFLWQNRSESDQNEISNSLDLLKKEKQNNDE